MGEIYSHRVFFYLFYWEIGYHPSLRYVLHLIYLSFFASFWFFGENPSHPEIHRAFSLCCLLSAFYLCPLNASFLFPEPFDCHLFSISSWTSCQVNLIHLRMTHLHFQCALNALGVLRPRIVFVLVYVLLFSRFPLKSLFILMLM